MSLVYSLRMIAGLVASVAFVQQTLAHHVSVNGPPSQAGPIVTASPDTLRKGEVVLGVQTQIINYEAFDGAELEAIAAAGFEEVHNTDSAVVASVAVEYGLTEDLTIGLVVPFVSRNSIREGELEAGAPEVDEFGDVDGFGDVSLQARYRLPAIDALKISVLAGLEIPTGETRERQQDGRRFETEFQPGSGSWDPSLGLAVSHPFGPIMVTANALYTLATEGSQDTDLGDNAALNIGAVYRIGQGAHVHDDGTFERHQAIDLVLELNGEWQDREEVRDVADSNSGGTQVFLSPGVRYSSADGWSSFASVGIPVHEDFRGVQNDTDVRVTAGVGFAF